MLMTFIYIFNIHEIKFYTINQKLFTFTCWKKIICKRVCVFVPCNYSEQTEIPSSCTNTLTHTHAHKYNQKSFLFAKKKSHQQCTTAPPTFFSLDSESCGLCWQKNIKKNFIFTLGEMFCLFLFSSVSEYLYRIFGIQLWMRMSF